MKMRPVNKISKRMTWVLVGVFVVCLAGGVVGAYVFQASREKGVDYCTEEELEEENGLKEGDYEEEGVEDEIEDDGGDTGGAGNGAGGLPGVTHYFTYCVEVRGNPVADFGEFRQ